MPVTPGDLQKEVGASSADIDVLTSKLAEANTLVDRYVTRFGDPDDPPPVDVLDAAYLAVAADLWYRRNAPHGITNEQYDAGMGASPVPIRISRDPMKAAETYLAQYVMSGFA